MLKKERKMKHRRFRTIRATVVLMVLAGVAILIAPAASAAAPTATATLAGSVGSGGTNGTFTFSITPSSRTLERFTLSAPAGWLIKSVDSSSAGGLPSHTDNSITVTGLSVSGSAVETITFTATACVAGSSSWTYTATDSQGRDYAHPSTLTASVGSSCTLHLLNQPADATQGQLITGKAFVTDSDAIQVELLKGATD